VRFRVINGNRVAEGGHGINYPAGKPLLWIDDVKKRGALIE